MHARDVHVVVACRMPSCPRTGANAFFRNLDIFEQWQSTNNSNSAGRGSPMLSKPVRRLLSAVKNHAKTLEDLSSATQPWMAGDFVAFARKAATLEADVISSFVERLNDEDHTGTSNPGVVVKHAWIEMHCPGTLPHRPLARPLSASIC